MAENDRTNKEIPVTVNGRPWPESKSHIRQRVSRRNAWRTVKLILGSFVCLVFVVAGAVFGRLYFDPGATGRLWRGMVGNVITGHRPDADWTIAKQYPYANALNVLILGVDHDYDNRDQIVRSANGRS